jgi:hypothetical protein
VRDDSPDRGGCERARRAAQTADPYSATVGATECSALAEILNADLTNDATTERGLTNHLPMALVAKAGLGAPAEELARFNRSYRRRLVSLREPVEQFSPTTWRRLLGVPEAYPELAAYFVEQTHNADATSVVRTHLPHLVSGVSGAAFHGVIRLAYALDAGSPDLIAHALAYFAASATPLGSIESGPTVSDNPEELLADLRTRDWWRGVASGALISEEMHLVASQPEFASVASRLAIDARTSDRLADAALKLYASTDDFTALHGVTGLEAIAKIRPLVEDVDDLDRFTFQALAAAYLAIGAPPLWSDQHLSDLVAERAADPAAIRQRAAMSNDEHVAKIVFTASRRFAVVRDSLYQAVAARAVQNDSTPGTPDAGSTTDD